MMQDTLAEFHSVGYLAHNEARLAHLRSLQLPWVGKKRTVLELGAGIGDHTKYWLDEWATVTAVEGRAENADLLRTTYEQVQVVHADVRSWKPNGVWDCVYAPQAIWWSVDDEFSVPV